MKPPPLTSSIAARPCTAGLMLIEWLATLAIVAVLTALAAPGFTPLVDRWRVRQTQGAIIAAIRLARAEAIQRGGNVVIQKIPNHSEGCTLAATPADWGCGWQVLADADAKGGPSAGQKILLSMRLPPGTAVRHSHGTGTIRVDRWGNMDGLNAKSFVVFPQADGIGGRAARTLCISAGGRIRSREGAAC